MQTLENHIAVVTGASRGIGLAIVEALAAQGARVAGAARTVTPELERAADLAVAVDLADPAGPGELVEKARAALGGIDILVNNVGRFDARHDGFAAVNDADWLSTFEINFLSPMRTIRAALPELLARRGSIINISSMIARVPAATVVDYGAAKAAFTNLSKALAEELGPQGVRVNTVSPGVTLTPAWDTEGGFGASVAAHHGASLDDFLRDAPAAFGVTTGRFTEAAEVAELVALLASPRVRNIHGVDYVIDGGQVKTA